MNDPILCEVSDGVALITLNRPDKLNAFSADLAEAWARTIIATVARSDVSAIVLAGAGRAFCAGGDVGAMAAGGYDEDNIEVLAHLINSGQVALLESAIPVIAAAQGTTAGGGLGILLNSDYAVVGESSRIGSIYGKLGLTPDLTVTALLARAVGERRALQLVLQDRLLSASEARDWGLVAEVVADDQVLTRALEVARFIVESSPKARGQAKRLVRASYERPMGSTLADEARTIGRALSGEEARTRIAEFIGA